MYQVPADEDFCQLKSDAVLISCEVPAITKLPRNKQASPQLRSFPATSFPATAACYAKVPIPVVNAGRLRCVDI